MKKAVGYLIPFMEKERQEMMSDSSFEDIVRLKELHYLLSYMEHESLDLHYLLSYMQHESLNHYLLPYMQHESLNHYLLPYMQHKSLD